MDRRRTIAPGGGGGENPAQSSIPVPSSIRRNAQQSGIPTPAARNSMAPGGGGRQSLAPGRAMSSGGAGRQSLAAFPLPSSQGSNDPFGSQRGGNAGNLFTMSQGSGSQGMVAPATVARIGGTYGGTGGNVGNMMAMSAGRADAGFMRSHGAGGPPPSVSRPGTQGRKSSIAPANSQNQLNPLVPTNFPRPTKDPRTRDKGQQHQQANLIVDFLSSHGYAEPITVQNMQQPTTKQFTSAFKFLISMFEPGHKFVGKKVEDEVIPILKAIAYPFADNISKSHLQSVGSMTSWPGLLAMLHWLVVSMKAREDATADMQLFPAPSQFMPQRCNDDPEFARTWEQQQHWIEFISRTYPDFLAGEEFEDDEPKRILEERFKEREERLTSSTQTLQAELSELEHELNSLRNRPKHLEEAQKQAEIVDRDLEKFADYIEKMADQVAQYQKQAADLGVEIGKVDAEIENQKGVKADLQSRVQAQKITQMDYRQMSAEKSTLDKDLQAAAQKNQDLTAAIGKLEILLSNEGNSAQTLSDDYQSKATILGVYPCLTVDTPERQRFDHVDFALDFNGALEDVWPPGAESVRPALQAMMNDAVRARREMSEANLAQEEKRARHDETKRELEEQISIADAGLQSLSQRLNEAQTAYQAETVSSNAELQRVQREVNTLKSTASARLHAIEQKVQAATVERAKVQAEAEDIRKSNHEAYMQQIHDIVYTYTDVCKRVNELKVAVAADLSN